MAGSTAAPVAQPLSHRGRQPVAGFGLTGSAPGADASHLTDSWSATGN